MNPVTQYDLAKIRQLRPLAHSEPEVVVFRLAKGNAILARGKHHVLPHEHSRMAQRVTLSHRPLKLGVFQRKAHRIENLTARVYLLKSYAEQSHRWIFVHEIYLLLEAFR